MTLVPVAAGARLLGIHPKTLRHWLTAAAVPLAAHPSDARLKCVAEEHLLALATQHGRPLSALAPLLMPTSDAASALAATHLTPLPAPAGEPAQQAAVLSAPRAKRSCSGSFPSSTCSSRPCSTTSPGSRWPSFTSEPDSLKTCCSSDCVPSKAVCHRPASRCWHAPRSTGQLLLLPPPLLSVTCCRWRCARSEERR